MNEPQMGPKLPDPHGHIWDDLDVPTPDDEGEMSSYAKCSRCGAVENTDESILDCTANPDLLTSLRKERGEE